MNLSTSGHQFDVTPAFRAYVTQKLNRERRHLDQIIDTQVILSAPKLRHRAEVTVHVPGKDIHCEATDENLYAAIDALIDKRDRQIIKHKSLLRSHNSPGIKRQPLQEDEALDLDTGT